MQALHFGAGNIGRGFIGKALSDAGIEVIFADIDTPLIDLLNQKGGYPVRIVAEGSETTERVSPVTAIDAKDSAALIDAIARVDLITTAVGPAVLENISKPLARGLLARVKRGDRGPVAIIACENKVRASSFLKEKVLAPLHPGQRENVLATTGFVDATVDRIVPQLHPDANQPLLVTVESFGEWIVDRRQFVAAIPDIPGMETTDTLMAFVERKLFTLNTGHAATAYFGKRKGIQRIGEAIERKDIEQMVKRVMQESGAVLIERYGFDPAEHEAYIERILERFSNPFLNDDVDRVGREPLRKLGPGERLVKPLYGTLEYRLPHDALTSAIAAALHYRNPRDEQALTLAQVIEQDGPQQAILRFCAIDDPALIKEILERYHALSRNDSAS